MSNDKSKALEATIAKIRKDFGDESIMDMGADPPQVESYSTGVLPLDVALGIGGIPKGRIIELFGPESSGKTTLAYHMMAEVQKAGGVAAFVDTEHAMDARYAANLGLQIEDLLVSQPDCGEDAMNIVDTMAKSGVVDLIVVDSVAALTPRAELEGAMGDSSVGVLARLMSQGCRKLIASCNQKGTTIVFINQIREKIGVMFGSPETQPGGRALKFYSSVRLDIRRIETIKTDGEATANRVRVKVVKNKVANPFTQAEFNIHFGTGADNLGSLIDLALEHDVEMVQKSGSFIKIDGHQEQGKAKATNYLRENPEVAAKLDAEIRSRLLPGYQAPEQAPIVAEEDGSEEEELVEA
jgi:recombination protein RecA